MGYHIILIERFNVLPSGDLEITAILENIKERKNKQDINTIPAFTPIRCRSIIDQNYLPQGVSFNDKTQHELIQTLDHYKLLFNQEWQPIQTDSRYEHST